MSYLLSLFLLLLPSISHADFIASAGLQGGQFLSNDKNDLTGNRDLKSSQIGFRGEIEFGYSYLTFFGGVDIGTGTGKAQYDFTDPDNALNSSRVDDLKQSSNLYLLSLGMRIKLIKTRRFRLFAAGGPQFGMLNITYDKEDFTNQVGSTWGLQQHDRANLKGFFGEVGMEFIIDANSGFRLSARTSSLKSEEILTLNNNELDLQHTSFAITYIEYIETGRWLFKETLREWSYDS